MYAPSDKEPQPTDTSKTLARSKRLMRSIIAQQMSTSGRVQVNVKYELDKYLAKDNEENKKGFDILKWWKDNDTRLSILPRMARNLVAIPISLVVSKSTFCAGGRTLDSFRTSLTPTITTTQMIL
jgi:hypothetical protein